MLPIISSDRSGRSLTEAGKLAEAKPQAAQASASDAERWEFDGAALKML